VTRDPNWKFEGTNLFPEYDPVLRTGVPYLLAHSRAIFLQTGIPPMAFTPSEAARSIASRLIPDHSPTVTLTLRLASFDTIRNSDLDAWDSAIVSLRNRGLDVAVLPDQDDCLNERLFYYLSEVGQSSKQQRFRWIVASQSWGVHKSTSFPQGGQG